MGVSIMAILVAAVLLMQPPPDTTELTTYIHNYTTGGEKNILVWLKDSEEWNRGRFFFGDETSIYRGSTQVTDKRETLDSHCEITTDYDHLVYAYLDGQMTLNGDEDLLEVFVNNTEMMVRTTGPSSFEQTWEMTRPGDSEESTQTATQTTTEDNCGCFGDCGDGVMTGGLIAIVQGWCLYVGTPCLGISGLRRSLRQRVGQHQ